MENVRWRIKKPRFKFSKEFSLAAHVMKKHAVKPEKPAYIGQAVCRFFYDDIRIRERQSQA